MLARGIRTAAHALDELPPRSSLDSYVCAGLAQVDREFGLQESGRDPGRDRFQELMESAVGRVEPCLPVVRVILTPVIPVTRNLILAHVCSEGDRKVAKAHASAEASK